MALSLTDFQPGFIAQRTAGTTGRANLGVSWQASAPGGVQARVVTAAGAVVADWQTCTGQSATGGVLPGPVPQGDNYRVQIRDGAGGAVQAGANAWGVGVVFAFHGQSNMRGILYGGWTGQEMDAYNNSAKFARSYYYTGWNIFGQNLDFNNDSLYLFTRELVAALGGNVPVGVVPVAENSRSIEAFLPGANGDVYYSFIAASASGKGDGNAGYASPPWVWGGDLEGVFYHQGEADVGQTDAWYKARLGTLHQQFLTQVAAYGRTAASFLFCPGLIASETPYADRNVGGMRRAVLDYVAGRRAAGDAVDVFSTADFATPLENDLHFGEDDARMAMRRLVQHAKRKVGAAGYGGRGPAVGSMSRSGRTVSVAVAHDGGAALHTRAGGTPSGFAASNDGFASHKVPLTASISGGGAVTLALPAEFDGRAATIGYLQAVPRSVTALLPTPAAYPVAGAVIDGDTRPDISNALYDDAAICPGVRGQSDPAAPGLPLLPTFGAWTLSDGQAITAPTGATSAGGGASSTGGGTGGGTATAPATPGKVTGLRLTSNSGTVIGYAFDAYVGAGSYRAEMRARGGGVASTDVWGGIDTLDASTTTGSKGGLVDNTLYDLRVLARDSAGATIATSDTVAVTIGTPVIGSTGASSGGTTTGGGASTGTATGPWADAGTLRLVGSGRTYSTIQAAVDAAAAGDTVVVDDGTYAPFRFSKRVLVRARNRLGATIDGKITGSFNIVDGKGAVLVTADGARLAGFRVTNGTSGAVGDVNTPVAGGEAGVRVDYGVGTFYVDGCRFDNNANGLFSGGPNTVYESNCEYGAATPNGATKDFKTHDIYVTSETVLFETRNSWHYGNPTGHDLKSRSKTTRVFGGYTVGKGIRNFDISDAGLFEASGAYVTHDPGNGQKDFLAIGPESVSNGANPNCKLTGGTIVSRQTGMRVSLQPGVGLTASGVTQVWVNDGHGAPTLELNAQGGTITGLSASPGGATVLAAMPAAPAFAYDASLAPGIAYTPAASTGTGATAGTGTSTGGTTTGGATTTPATTGSTQGSGGTGTTTTTTPSTGANTTGAQVAYFKLDGKVALDAATSKLIVAALSGGGTPAASTVSGTPSGGTSTGSTGGTTGGTATGGTAGTGATTGGGAVSAPAATAKVTNLRVTSISGTTVYYAWDAYAGAASYRAEVRARDGANATDAWSGIATTDASTTSESKGGLPDNTTYQFRITARDSAGATLAVSDPLTVVLGTPAAAATGSGAGTTAGSTGTGSTGTASGGTLPAGGSASGALALTAKVQVPRAVTEPVVRWFQGFAPGEMGDGDRLVATLPDGTAVPIRPAARRRTWPSAMGGGVRGRTYDATLPGSYAAGQVATLTLTKTAGAADLGAAKTLAAIRADSDLKIVFSGYELGGPFQVRLNDLIDGGAPARPWGNNPTWGLDILSANQERVSLRAWAFLRRVSDGAIHRTLKGTLYADWVRGGGGGYLLGAAWVQDTAYGSHPAGTVGPTDGPKRFRFQVEAFDGSRFLHAWGGPRDPRARTRPAGAFHDSLLDAPDQPLGLDWACGVGMGFSGPVPGGLNAGTAYYIRWTDGGTGLYLNRRDDSRVTFGNAGGDVLTYPVMHSYAGQGGIGMDAGDIARVWTGAGANPSAWFAPDQQHLFKRTRLTLPYRDDVARDPMGGTPRPHTPGEVYSDVIWSISSPSDNPSDSRLGPIPYYAARWLMAPHDPVSRAFALSQAVSWADFPTHFRDERSGGPVVTSNGPNNDGVTYPGQAPVNPAFASFLNDTLGSPAFGPAQKASWRGSIENRHGYDEDYQNANSYAHTPNYWQVPYLLTGDQAWLDLGINTAATTGYLWDHTHDAKGVYYTPIIKGQQRGIGWAYRELSNVDAVLPDDDVDRVVFEDYLRIQGRYWFDRVDEAPGRHLGKPWIPGENYDIGGRPFQEYMLSMMTGMIYWRNQDPNWRKLIDCVGRYIMGAFDDTALNASGQARNGAWLCNEYGLHGNDFQNVTGGGANRIWSSIDEMLQYSNEPAFDIPQAGPSPYPQSGLRRDQNDFGNYTYDYNGIAYVHMLVAALAVWSSAGVPGAKRVREQILRRIYGGTLKEIGVNSNHGPVPQYAAAPVPGSPS